MIQTIIVAGGKGMRMESDVPKQFMLLSGRPVLMHSMTALAPFSDKIILVLPSQQVDYWRTLVEDYQFDIPHIVVEGGQERFFSVKNALKELKREGLVLVHDGVRPLVSSGTIKRVIETSEQHGNAIPCMDLNESLRYSKGDENYAVDRSLYKHIQTPQAFDAKLFYKSYEQDYQSFFTDDASVFEAAGYSIVLTEGNRANIKITHKEDLLWAEYLLKMQK